MKIKILTMNSVCFFKAMIFIKNTYSLKRNSAYKKKRNRRLPIPLFIITILHAYFFSHFIIAIDFIEIHIAINLVALLIDDTDIGLVFFNGGNFTQF